VGAIWGLFFINFELNIIYKRKKRYCAKTIYFTFCDLIFKYKYSNMDLLHECSWPDRWNLIYLIQDTKGAFGLVIGVFLNLLE
jgi:hypothetical protein